ncbi:hypothetical protein D3C76_1759060 [compost metagenome]
MLDAPEHETLHQPGNQADQDDPQQHLAAVADLPARGHHPANALGRTDHFRRDQCPPALAETDA